MSKGTGNGCNKTSARPLGALPRVSIDIQPVIAGACPRSSSRCFLTFVKRYGKNPPKKHRHDLGKPAQSGRKQVVLSLLMAIPAAMAYAIAAGIFYTKSPAKTLTRRP
jgi:hypothetical protein